MSKTSARLLAAGAALLSLTAAPAANAAEQPEATVAAYIFSNGTVTHGIYTEQGDLTAPHLASGYTAHHPGWDIRLSDETYGAGLPKQDFRAKASDTSTSASAGTSGFISLVDGDSRDVPFAVLKLGSRSVSCTTDGPLFTGGGGSPRLWLRQHAGELYEVDVLATGTTSAVIADDVNGTRTPTTVKVNSISTTAQAAAWPQFAKYDGRAKAGAIGHELEITQQGRTFKILAGVSAASC
ncbi:hypothetical protein SK803_22735 [Lentzea sp. BCCO 10_0856]|uniref:Secreted protein n=1 Tax=Lentzea miocenica TaxID=3095431 RepID=A0ABU4T4H9_9PSEU|nr:hypothetical protein [Lentzea sp. BCCO 10_0856]MDX8033043.1 hypothetical protein [Lentzea sp. BCCO 10_0856]